MLLQCYGPTIRGAVNCAAVAEYVGVTPDTVRRWISGGRQDRRRRTSCPPARIARLQRGPEVVEIRNQQQYERAKQALSTMSGGGNTPLGWAKWLEPHRVVICEISGKPWHQVAVTKGDPRAMADLRRRATLLDTVEAATWFHGQVLAHEVMTLQQHWRVHPDPDQLEVGRTQVWMADAPPIDLAELAAQVGADEGARKSESIADGAAVDAWDSPSLIR